MRSESQISNWRAVEALRAGVPNRDAVQILGIGQPHIEDRFKEQLGIARDSTFHGKPAVGTLIAGDFGSGKSHMLEYLQHIALAEGFVCSKIVISKETPLYDPGKVYVSAIQAARVPGKTGAAMTEIATALNFDSPEYASFYEWINHPGNGLSSRFPATVFVFEKAKGERHPEYADRITQFWAGNRIKVSEIRGWLKELRERGQEDMYNIVAEPPKALSLQYYSFAPRLMIAAGYAGWVILLDEVELIGRYSFKQRAKSYGQLARLMGKLEDGAILGLTTVLSITSDFEAAVIDERGDESKIPHQFLASDDDQSMLASQAECGIRIIRHERVQIRRPDTDSLRGIIDEIRTIHADAYGWDPPVSQATPDRTAQIRQHIKRQINEWDLRRLYPEYKPETVIDDLRQDLSEMIDLERVSEDTIDDNSKDS